jgi:hypothetical protein
MTPQSIPLTFYSRALTGIVPVYGVHYHVYPAEPTVDLIYGSYAAAVQVYEYLAACRRQGTRLQRELVRYLPDGEMCTYRYD